MRISNFLLAESYAPTTTRGIQIVTLPDIMIMTRFPVTLPKLWLVARVTAEVGELNEKSKIHFTLVDPDGQLMHHTTWPADSPAAIYGRIPTLTIAVDVSDIQFLAAGSYEFAAWIGDETDEKATTRLDFILYSPDLDPELQPYL